MPAAPAFRLVDKILRRDLAWPSRVWTREGLWREGGRKEGRRGGEVRGGAVLIDADMTSISIEVTDGTERGTDDYAR